MGTHSPALIHTYGGIPAAERHLHLEETNHVPSVAGLYVDRSAAGSPLQTTTHTPSDTTQHRTAQHTADRIGTQPGGKPESPE